MTPQIEAINLEAIPRKVIRLKYPEYLPDLEPQETRRCGTNCIRSMLRCGCGHLVEEKELAEKYEEEINDKGANPLRVVEIFLTFDNNGMKVFRTCDGDIDQLVYLTERRYPVIIHRLMTEPGFEGETHYEFLIGIGKANRFDEEKIYLYNSLRIEGLATSGFYRMPVSSFINEWWPAHIGNRIERWYLTAIEKDTKLPGMFRGKYN